MSLISSFLINHLVPALEKAFIAHEPEAQAAFLDEVKVIADQVAAWIESKLSKSAE